MAIATAILQPLEGGGRDYDRLVADWRTSVGDTIRQEYLAEIQHKA